MMTIGQFRAERREFWNVLKAAGMLAGVVGVLLVLGGCSALNNDPILKRVDEVSDKVLVPIANNALAKSNLDAASVQGGIQGINPHYHVHVRGMWVTGFDGDVEAGINGVAGQLQGSSQGHGDKSAVGAPASAPAAGLALAAPKTLTVTISDVDADNHRGFARLPDGSLVSVINGEGLLGKTVKVSPIGGDLGGDGSKLITAEVVQ